ncbi:hypothetical protein DRP53_06570 [candidate division WOR-3 bacterium]|uniref:HD domain-containing protein n=1 Tax=candidate division WOR-3 bacterium TaxID=2052148 RepID=A0A660SGW9_UNCW3|nr:MAG: hypothetical protein DRP53_06570 [candidate division WOR-3 bacterium]
MIDFDRLLAKIFDKEKNITLLYWNPIEARLAFFNPKNQKLEEWQGYIGKRLAEVETELGRKGAIPLSMDGRYTHGILFSKKVGRRELDFMIGLFIDWYLGVYLKTAFKHSLELRERTDSILRMKSPKRIITAFAQAVTTTLNGKKYELISKRKITEASFGGSFPDFEFVLPFRVGEVAGIRIKGIGRVLPNEITLKYLENISAQFLSFLQLQQKFRDMAQVRRRFEFLKEFSTRFHELGELSYMMQFIQRKIGTVLDIESAMLTCRHADGSLKSQLVGRDLNRGYGERRENGKYIYVFPAYVHKEVAALLRLTTTKPLNRDDISFLKFLINEIEVIINLHAASKEQEKKIAELETAYEIANFYPFLTSPEEAYVVLAEKICRKTGFDIGAFVAVEGDEFVALQPIYGLKQPEERIAMKIHETEVMYSVYHSKKPFYTNSIRDQSFITRRIAARFGVERFVCLPYIFKDKVLGLFLTGRKENGPEITEDDIRLLKLLVNQAAILIQGLKSSAELNRQIRELRLINEISSIANSTLYLNELVRLTLQKLRGFIPHPYLAIFTYNEFGNILELVGHLGFQIPDPSYRVVKPGIGIVGNAALIRMPVLANDVSEDNRYIKMLDDVQAELSIPIVFQDRLLGVLDIQSPIKNAFKPEEVGLLSTIANQLASAIENARLHERVEETLTDAVRALVMTIDASDPYTRGHSERVTDYAVEIATELGLPQSEIDIIRKAALLHDIGKIGISELILLKKEKLSTEEMDEVKLHPLLGAQMLDGVRGFEEVRNLIKCHHEGYNGDGYPYGLRGEEIPLGARIIAVADVYEALTSDRPYRPAYSKAQAIEILKSEAGGHLDPKIVSVFIKILSRKE